MTQGPFQNQTITLNTITEELKHQVRSASTADQKRLLYVMAQGLAHRIKADGDVENFQTEDFLRACNISPDWGKAQAA